MGGNADAGTKPAPRERVATEANVITVPILDAAMGFDVLTELLFGRNARPSGRCEVLRAWS
jgi:hypothetical protein